MVNGGWWMVDGGWWMVNGKMKKQDFNPSAWIMFSDYLPLTINHKPSTKGQSILEYTIVLGVIVIIMSAMGPMIKRGTQSLIKVVADQVGVQQNAEQKFDESGHLEASYMSTRGSMDKQTLDSIGITGYIFNDLTITQSNALMNLGYTEKQ